MVVLGHTRHPPVNDVIASEHSIDVFLRYWFPGYPDCSGVGRQGCYFRCDWRNWKRDEVMRSWYIEGRVEGTDTRGCSLYVFQDIIRLDNQMLLVRWACAHPSWEGNRFFVPGFPQSLESNTAALALARQKSICAAGHKIHCNLPNSSVQTCSGWLVGPSPWLLYPSTVIQ